MVRDAVTTVLKRYYFPSAWWNVTLPFCKAAPICSDDGARSNFGMVERNVDLFTELVSMPARAIAPIHVAATANARRLADRPQPVRRTGAAVMTEKRKGSATAQRANVKAAKEGKSNPHKFSATYAELGRNGGKAKSSD